MVTSALDKTVMIAGDLVHLIKTYDMSGKHLSSLDDVPLWLSVEAVADEIGSFTAGEVAIVLDTCTWHANVGSAYAVKIITSSGKVGWVAAEFLEQV